MGRWVDEPPAPCHATKRDQRLNGPYWVDDSLVMPMQVSPDGLSPLGRPRLLVTAASHFNTIMSADRSPFILVPRDEDAALRAYVEDLEAEIAELKSALEEASASPIDERALLDNVRSIVRDEMRRPDKSGPNPKKAA